MVYSLPLICFPGDIAETEYPPEIWGDEMIDEAAFMTRRVEQIYC